MSARVVKKKRAGLGSAWRALMRAEGLCVVPDGAPDGSQGWRAVYGVPAPVDEPDKPMPRVVGHGSCPLVAAVVAMERTVVALREGRAGLCLSMGGGA